MFARQVKVRNGTQIRVDPITSTEVRINPARALRPMCVGSDKSPSQQHNDDVLPIILLDKDIELIQYLIFNGLRLEDVNHFFHHHTPQIMGQTPISPIPTLQFYKKTSHTHNLSPALTEIIEKSSHVNPFHPPHQLIKNIVPIDKTILSYVDTKNREITDPNRYLQLFTEHDVLCYAQATSSIQNCHLWEKLVKDESEKVGERYFFVPCLLDQDIDSSSRVDHIPLSIVNITELYEKYLNNKNNIHTQQHSEQDQSDYLEILSTTGQLWGYFTTTPPTKPRTISYPLQIALPYAFPLQIHLQYGIMALSESAIFLNKFPFAHHHTVIVIAQESYIKLNHFKSAQLFFVLYNIFQYFNAIQANFASMLDHNTDYDSNLFENPQNVTQTAEIEYYERFSPIIAPDHPPTLTPTVVWNYLPSSAGSLIHPHFQAYVEDFDNIEIRSIKTNVDQFYRETVGKVDPNSPIPTHIQVNLQKYSIYQEYQLLQQKKEKEKNISKLTNTPNNEHSVVYSMVNTSRYIGMIPVDDDSGLAVHIIAPFGPKMNNEVNIYICNLFPSTEKVTHINNFAQLTHRTSVIKAIAKAFVAVLQIYNAMGITSYNMSSTSAPVCGSDIGHPRAIAQESIDQMLLSFAFVSRPNVAPNGVYTNDSGPLERLLMTNVVSTPPEVYSATMRDIFDSIYHDLP